MYPHLMDHSIPDTNDQKFSLLEYWGDLSAWLCTIDKHHQCKNSRYNTRPHWLPKYHCSNIFKLWPLCLVTLR